MVPFSERQEPGDSCLERKQQQQFQCHDFASRRPHTAAFTSTRRVQRTAQRHWYVCSCGHASSIGVPNETFSRVPQSFDTRRRRMWHTCGFRVSFAAAWRGFLLSRRTAASRFLYATHHRIQSASTIQPCFRGRQRVFVARTFYALRRAACARCAPRRCTALCRMFRLLEAPSPGGPRCFGLPPYRHFPCREGSL